MENSFLKKTNVQENALEKEGNHSPKWKMTLRNDEKYS